MSESLIFESKKSKVYKLDKNEWNKPVLLKILNYEFPTPVDIAQFYNEFDIIDNLELTGVRKPLKKSKYNGRHCMYLEWVEGKVLREAFKGKQNDILDFLYLAISMAQAVGELHQKNIIHKDLNPNNILVNLQERFVKLISFGIASKIDLKKQHLGNPEHLEGTLAYISPEQTGRMNRVVDYRTDLYSLGVTFYEMLADKPPFVATDAMEMVHSHLAVHSKPLYKVNPLVPKPISDIIEILLAKKVEDRYQSAFGLKYDLDLCLKEFEKNRKIPEFTLGTNDYSGRFTLPQKLYGREKELATILERFDHVASGGLELVLIGGYSGTGKSALVSEVHKPITEKRGYFIGGKFDQFQRAVPYYAFLQAFNEFVNILLTESKEKLVHLKQLIIDSVGEEGKVLTDVLPALEFIIGPQPEIPELGGAESQNRFNYIFRKFVAALCLKEHPIVLFIDDLQWADSSSLSLLNILMTDPNNGYLLCICAYRDNEVSPTHPFMITVEDLRNEGAGIVDVNIGNLPLDNVNHLIADTLFKSKDECRNISQLLYEKTRGNAFFSIQFLLSLYEESLLYFDYSDKIWKYSLGKIKERRITDNVVELIAGKAKKLPENSLIVLKNGACIGNSFDLRVLSVINEKDDLETLDDLQPALAEGLILPAGGGYKFAHDRIQQAVYSLMSQDEKDLQHLKIGRLLLENKEEENIDEFIFDIVNHLNSSIKLIDSQDERDKLCKLNLKAGKKAKETSAFKVAFDYLETGIALLKPNAWEEQYETALNLHALAGETAYLNGDFKEMDIKINQVFEHAKEFLHKVKSYEIRILAFKAENKLIDAINTGLEFLEQVGEKFPKKPIMPHVMRDLIKTKILLRGKNNDIIKELPVMTDESKIAAMRIIADIASSSYWATPTLFPLLIFRMVHISLKYGNTSVSAFAFATYGVILCGVLGDMKNGYKFGKLGLILLEKFNAKEWKTQIYTPIYCLIVNWNEHIDKTLKPLQESYHIGMETGAIEFACINTNIYCIHSYLSGKRLERLEVETKAYSESFARFKQETNFNYNEVFRQPMLNLLGKVSNPTIITGEAFDEEKMIAQNDERNDRTGQFFIHFNKLILCYLFADYKNALHHATESRKLLEAVLAKFEIPNHHFYEALTMLALYPKASASEKRKYLSRVNKNARKLKKWAKNAPESFQHKYELLQAEKHQLQGNINRARLHYENAIKGAGQHDFIHEEAIALELAGKFYLKLKSDQLAGHFLKGSYNSYREWGALAKLIQLEQEYPQFVSGVTRNDNLNTTISIQKGTSSISSGNLLDINTVLKSSATISGEIVLDKLLNTLIKIVLENAGADRGFILLKQNNELLIQASSEDSGRHSEVLLNKPYIDSGLLANSIISYVMHSKKSIVVQDAQNDPRYLTDSHVKNSKVQSILSLPILNRGSLTGVLYLENTLATAVFTQDRIELLALLSGQIAVSIENAILYENLEQKVAERTEELEREKQKSDELLLNILPFETAEELKLKGTTTPRKFEKVTVMFSDFKGFTKLSENLSPEELVEEIGTCFSAFDQIIDKYNLEKIKTIGDAYMCVGGLPVPNSTHAIDMVSAAMEIIDFIEQRKQKQISEGKPVFEIRIGLHTGPVIAGVVGAKKFVYDIWGDTVNTASRMESSSEVGKVNISGSTYNSICNKFECSYRGKIEAKNKGEIDMYFVEKEKSIAI